MAWTASDRASRNRSRRKNSKQLCWIDCGSSPGERTGTTANPDIIASKYPSSGFQVHHSEISGVWSLVVLDGCRTAENNNWPGAFQIYANNSLGRVYIGWNESGLPDKAYIFSQYFFTAVKDYLTSSLLSNIYTQLETYQTTTRIMFVSLGIPTLQGENDCFQTSKGVIA